MKSHGEMRYFKIHAYVRCHLREKVEQTLMTLGIEGFSFFRVKGMGEYADHFKRLSHVEHAEFEVFVPATDVDLVVEAVLQVAGTRGKGDGLIAVMPVDRVVRIRNREELTHTRRPHA